MRGHYKNGLRLSVRPSVHPKHFRVRLITFKPLILFWKYRGTSGHHYETICRGQ
jgi:hypothetical protein